MTNKEQDKNLHQSSDNLPANILLEKWADIGFDWQGKVQVQDFSRLSEQVHADALDKSTLDIQATLSKKDKILWLYFKIEGCLLVSCQRCLSPMPIDVSGERRLALLNNEHEQSAIDGAEFVLIDEVCPPDSRKILPLKDLLEDELLLALPLSPRHLDCQTPIALNDNDLPEKERENPFAVLASLKGRL